MWSLDRKYKGVQYNNFKKAVHHAAHHVVHVVSILTAKTRLIYHCCFLRKYEHVFVKTNKVPEVRKSTLFLLYAIIYFKFTEIFHKLKKRKEKCYVT